VTPVSDWATWRTAMEHALYGADGFYRRPGPGPASHFRTSVHASPLFAAALHRLARSCGLSTVVDVGAGGGELLFALRGLDPGLRLHGVEVAARPADLPADVGWSSSLTQSPPEQSTDVLVVANEWLDNVPLEVLELTAYGLRVVEVSVDGRERLGGPATAGDARWVADWWPLTDVGSRAEVGRSRDEAWARVVGSVRRGVAVAVDYAHDRARRPEHGSLAAYRHGRQVPPVPDGTCDLTAHVALDACAAGGEAAGATATVLTTQAEALHGLGVHGARPARADAEADPSAYLQALARAGEAAELTDPAGLGGFGWLLQPVGMSLPVC
jgi:SAM-dependent MidA family methyltransferase